MAIIPEIPDTVVTEPVVTEPVAIIPEIPDTVVTEPAVTEPVAIIPEIPDTIVTEPVVTAPVEIVPDIPAPIIQPQVTEPVINELIVVVTETPAGVTDEKTNSGKGNTVFVAANNSEVTIYSKDEAITGVYVYSLGHKQLFEKSNINANEFVISGLHAATQILIIKTQLKNGKWSTNKVVL